MDKYQDFNDWDNTGAQEGASVVYLNFDTKTTQKIRRGKATDADAEYMDAFAGVLSNFKVEWEGEQNGDVPPHWNYMVYLNAKDKRDDKVKTFCLTVCSHWSNPMLSDLVNHLSGAIDAGDKWNGFLKISFWTKETASKRKIGRLSLYDQRGNRLPLRHKWNEAEFCFEGVPKGEDGDYSAQEAFWHNLAFELAAHFGNSTSEPAASETKSTPTPPPSSQAPAAPKKFTPAELKERKEKFYTLLVKKFEATSPESIIDELERIWADITGKTNLQEWGTTLKELEGEFTACYTSTTGDAGGYMANGKIIVGASTSPADDGGLPF